MASVLIVDDDFLLNDVLTRMLSIGGHIVVGQAYNGAEAVEMFDRLNPKPDIILMDYRMPVMDGTSATRKIIQIHPGSRIIFISADDTVRVDALNAGALGFLTKPIRSNTLFAAIEKCVAS
ncbi:MAG: response regulator [Candidatus Thorarchaeota archaeon]